MFIPGPDYKSTTENFEICDQDEYGDLNILMGDSGNRWRDAEKLTQTLGPNDRIIQLFKLENAHPCIFLFKIGLFPRRAKDGQLIRGVAG